MADIRINALATTAASTASDDFIAVDGSANGTRKLNAYSPTFGGNLTVSGTGTIGNQLKVTNASVPDLWLQNTSGATSAYRNILLRQNSDNTFKFLSISDAGVLTRDNIITGSNDTGAIGIGVAPGAGVNSLTVAGNLTVAGGTATLGSDASLVRQGNGWVQIANTSGSFAFGGYSVTTNRTDNYVGLRAINNTGGTSFGEFGVGSTATGDGLQNYGYFFTGAGLNGIRLFTNGSTTAKLTIDNAGLTTLAGNLTVSGTGNSSVAGTLLVATTTNSGNGKIQLATHTTSAGGIGFGTDTTLSRATNAGWMILGTTGTSSIFFLQGGGSGVYFNSTGSNFATGIIEGSGSLLLRTGNTTALTLDSSQNATFAGTVEVSKSAASTNLNALTLRNSAYNVGESTSIVLTHGTGSGKPVTSISSYLPGSNQSELVFYTSNTSAVSTEALRINGSQNATFAGSIAIGNTVNTVSPTSPNRTITMVIGGTTYYIHAKTTND